MSFRLRISYHVVVPTFAFGHQMKPACGATTSASLDINLVHGVVGKLELPADIFYTGMRYQRK